MRYKLGDFVRFVDEKLEGYVTRIIDEQMIGVTVEDDFEIPVLASKVTYVHGHGAASHDEDYVAPTSLPAGEFKSKGVYIAVVTDAKANALVHLYLVNETSYQLLTAVTTEQQKTLRANLLVLLSLSLRLKYILQNFPTAIVAKVHFSGFVFHQAKSAFGSALNITEQFKAKDFSGAKKLVPILKQQAWLIQLDEPELVIDAKS
jgi:hypothetical protein